VKGLGSWLLAAFAGAGVMAATGCRSDWIDVSVMNQTGHEIRELEVDYPSASFGFDRVGPGSEMHYRVQIRGQGAVKVSYSLPGGGSPHAEGVVLSEHEHGQLRIRLLPDGKVEFQPALQPGT
jgi:hypothetical protein